MATLTIIGGGNVGKSLGRVWVRERLVQISFVLNRSQLSAERAVAFIGQGKAATNFSQLSNTDLIMISVPDDAIESCVQALADARIVQAGTVVFHCSGSLSSNVLSPVAAQGALIGSVHPVKSFADPATAAESFAGTPCGMEGDPVACERLEQLFAAAGGRVFRLNSDSKLLYHAGTVMVCNYLAALMEMGLRCYEAAGISRPKALEMAAPIVQETVRNIFALGPARALTGPISRGDAKLVDKQLSALQQLGEDTAATYRNLGLVAADLAREKGQASPEAIAAIVERLRQ